MSKLLTISAIRNQFSLKQCCNLDCMANQCRMPSEYRIGDESVLAYNNNNNNHVKDLVFFTNLVTEARSKLEPSSSPKERIKHWILFFENMHHTRDQGSTKVWTYQICTTLCAPIFVCRSAFCAVYGVDAGTIDTCQRIIRSGRSVESRDALYEESTAKDAIHYFGLDLKQLPEVNQNLDCCPDSQASLSLVAYLENEFYFLGDQEVNYHDKFVVFILSTKMFDYFFLVSQIVTKST